MTGTSQTISATNGSPNITFASGVATNWVVGATIQGTGWATGTKIVSITGTPATSTAAVLSNNFTGTTGSTTVIASSNNATAVLSLSASGDTASPQNIISLGLGALIAPKTIQIYGRTFIELQIAQGATYDDTEWTYLLGLYSYIQANETYTGTWRSGFVLVGSSYVKAKGATIMYQQARAVAGGTSCFKNSGIPAGFPANKFKAHWNDVAWIGLNGTNYAMSPQMFYGEWYQCGDIVYDGYGDGGANGSFAGSYGSIEKLSMLKYIGGINVGYDTTQIATVGKIEWFCIPTFSTNGTNPDIKLGTPNNVPVSGFAPIFHNTAAPEQEFIGVNSTATEIIDDYILPTNYPLITNSRNYNTNTRTYRRTVSLTFKDSATASALTGVTAYITSGANVLANAVQAGDFSQKLNTVFVSWAGRSPASGSYIAPLTSTDTQVQAAQIRKNGYVAQSFSYNLTNAAYSREIALIADPAYGSVTPAQAAALTGIALDYTNDVVTGSASRNLDQVYAFGQYSQALPANSAQADFQSSPGGVYRLTAPWKLNWTAGALTMGEYNTRFISSTQWKFGNTASLNLDKDDVTWTPAARGDLFQFESGSTFNITNGSTLTVSPTAGLGYGAAATSEFRSGSTLNLSDSTVTYNIVASGSGTVFSNTEAGATWNISNSTLTLNCPNGAQVAIHAYFLPASTITNFTVNGTATNVIWQMGYTSNNSKMVGFKYGGAIFGNGTSNILMDTYTYTGSLTTIPNTFGSANKWYWVDPTMQAGGLFRWAAGATATGSSGFYGVIGFRPTINIDKTGYAPKVRFTPSAMATRYPAFQVQATELSTLGLSSFFRDPTFMAASDGFLPFVDSLDDKTVINTINWTADFRQKGWLGQTVTFTASTAKKGTVTYTASGAVDANYINDTTGAADAALITVDEVGKVLAAASGTLAWSAQRMYNALVNKWASFAIEQNIVAGSTGGSLDLANYTVDESIHFVRGSVTDLLSQVKTTGIIESQVNEIPVADVNGSRASISGLDPLAFGVTWYLRWKPEAGSTWSYASGTGNSTQILVDTGVYTVQVRARGYDWKTLSFDTDLSLSLDLGLSWNISSNNTPQYTMPFDAALEAIFQYDATSMQVSVNNITGGIVNPGFAELYQATQRIMHLSGLVWTWTNPIKANATSQKIIIPTGNPLQMFLTAASNASVKLTCPVIHEDSGSSADDRVRGNASGYSIILGSPATAESAGLQAAIVADILAATLKANVVQVNTVPVSGTGAEGDEWGPAA